MYGLPYLLLLGCFALGSAEVLRWKRNVDGLKDGEIVVVNEFVSVEQDKRQILMSAFDSSLIKTKYYPSLSLHDFEAEDGMGLVALKIWDHEMKHKFCFISEVAHRYEETIEEVKERNDKVIDLQKPQKKFTFSRHDEMGLEQLKEKSPALAEFCSDVKTYRLNVISDHPKLPWIPFHTLCIWYPYPIFPNFPAAEEEYQFPWPPKIRM